MCKEATVTKLKVLCRYLLGGTYKTHENFSLHNVLRAMI